MIEKVLAIKNVGRFIDFQLKGSPEWNGSLSRVNVIYAPNGSGKTTLTNILQSAAKKSSTLIKGRRSDVGTTPQEVKLKMVGSSSIVEYSNNAWSAKIDNIVIFDVHFVEDYLFSGSSIRKNHKTNLFNFLIGTKADVQRSKINKLYKQVSASAKHKKPPTKKSTTTEIESHNKHIQNVKEYKEAIKEYEEFTKVSFDVHITRTNRFLQRFNPHLKLRSIELSGNSSQELFRLLLTFDVHGRVVSFNATESTHNQSPVKFSMSEGDKNAVALAFFLAHVEQLNLNVKTVIFDDPLSSFDAARKSHTINFLTSISENAAQFILLTHDLHFAKDFTDRINHLAPTNLKIYNDGITSRIIHHEIQKDVTTSLQKDLMVIKSYIANPNDVESTKRDTVRCIRPVLESILKIKYFDEIYANQWLGDIINLIRNADSNHVFTRLKPLLDDIISLNDYSKAHHHTGGSNPIDPINTYELRLHCDMLLNVFYQI